MKRPSIYNQRRSGLDVMMTPMIDVVFLLLVFFLATASFEIVEHVMPSQLSRAVGTTPTDEDTPPPPEADFDEVIVRLVNVDGRVTWTVNRAPMTSLADLQQHLKIIAGVKNDAPVILHPDADVALGDVIDVYDISRRVGFVKVQFAASEAV
ncbi:MAG: biopolymer transporter ExbD [Pirellulaceae bacterium]